MATISLSGLDTSFLEDAPPPPKRTKKKFTHSKRSALGGPFLMGDITPFVSPLGNEQISSRSQLREHEKKHEVRQCGELKKPADFSVWKND